MPELGWRFEDYHPNDPEEGADYHIIFAGNSCLSILDSKGGRLARIGVDWRDTPLLLRLADLYGAERRGWRWPQYWLWYHLGGKRRCSTG